MENQNQQLNIKEKNYFGTIFSAVTGAHLLIDLILWGILYLPQDKNFLLSALKGTGILWFILIFVGAGISLISYILSISGLVKIIKGITGKAKLNYVVIICFIINLILLLVALQDPNSLYNFHS